MGVIITGSLTLMYALPKIAVVGVVLAIMMVQQQKAKFTKNDCLTVPQHCCQYTVLIRAAGVEEHLSSE